MDNLEDLSAAVGEFTETAASRFDQLARRLDEVEAYANARPGRGRQTQPEPLGSDDAERPRAGANRVVGPAARHSDTFGFRHVGEFYMAVKSAGIRGGNGAVDERLLAAAPSTFGNESSGTDGGFSVPPTFRAAIMEKAFGETSLMARTMQIPVVGNSLTVPTSMTTPWDTTRGVQANWEGEAAAIGQSKPSLESVTIRLHKLAALVPVSDELLEDSGAMGVLVNREASAKIDFKLSNAIVRGTGSGQPLGFLNAGCLVTQAAEASQVADSLNATNIAKMAARLPASSRTSAVWLIHPDAEHQLPLMTIGDQPIYMPAGGFRDSPFGSLLGRPVIPHQVAATVGDLGDLMLVDLGEYLTAVKAGGLRAETSIHLWFDQDLTAFRFIVRVAGQPWWSEATTSRDGSFTQSPFVVLAART